MAKERRTAKRGLGHCSVGWLSVAACLGLLLAAPSAPAAEGPSASGPLPPAQPVATGQSVTASITHLCDLIGHSGAITAVNGLGQPVGSASNAMTNLAVHLCQLSGAYEPLPREGLEPGGLPPPWREPSALVGLNGAPADGLPTEAPPRLPQEWFRAEPQGAAPPWRPAPANVRPVRPAPQDDLVSQLLNSAGTDTTAGDSPYAMRRVPTYPAQGPNGDANGYGAADVAYGTVPVARESGSPPPRSGTPSRYGNETPSSSHGGEPVPDWILTVLSAVHFVRNSSDLQYLIVAAILLGLSLSWFRNRRGN